MSMLTVNCVYYIFGTGRCSNKNIKRRWFGILGPRYCILTNPKDWRISCNFKMRHKAYVSKTPKLPSKKAINKNVRHPWHKTVEFSGEFVNYFEELRKQNIPPPPEPPKPPPCRNLGLDLSRFFKRK